MFCLAFSFLVTINQILVQRINAVNKVDGVQFKGIMTKMARTQTNKLSKIHVQNTLSTKT